VLGLLAEAFEALGHHEKAALVRAARAALPRPAPSSPGEAARPQAPRASAHEAPRASAPVVTEATKTAPKSAARRAFWITLSVALALAAIALVGSRVRGLPSSDWWLAIAGDAKSGATWAQRCADHLQAGRLDAADRVCSRGLAERGLREDAKTTLHVTRALALHRAQRDRDAITELASALTAGPTAEIRAAVDEVCAAAATAPLPDEAMRTLVFASDAAPVLAFANRAGGKYTFELRGTECVAITPPILNDDGTMWVRIARDAAPVVNSIESDVRYGYVSVAAVRAVVAPADSEDCQSLTRGGIAGRARFACQRAALDLDPARAAIAVAGAARAWIRLGDSKRALPWIAAGLQLDNPHTHDWTGMLDEACAAVFGATNRGGRAFKVVDWPWDARDAAFGIDPLTSKKTSIPTGTCVLVDPGDADTSPSVEAWFEGRSILGHVHRSLLRR